MKHIKRTGRFCAILLALIMGVTVAHGQEDSVLRIGTSLTQMPWGFYDEEQKPTGVDVSLCGALAEELGKKAEFINLDFKGLIPALQADRFDMVCAAAYITPERQQAVAMIPYMQTSQTIITKQTSDIETIDDLCGHRASVLQGSESLKVLEARSGECVAANGQAIFIQSFDTQPVALRALENDSVDAFIASDSLISYYMTKSQGLKKIATSINPMPLGIAVRHGNEALEQQIRQALISMQKSGKYGAVLDQWNLQSAAIAMESQ